MRHVLLLLGLAAWLFGGWESILQAGITVEVPELAKVRSGPGTVYDQIGELTKGQTAAATGRSQYNDWVQIDYASAAEGKGWVYANLITLRGGAIEQLPLAGAPPTATLPPTPAGAESILLATQAPARLPTFTPPAPVTAIAYSNPAPVISGFPPALLIGGLLGLGLAGLILAILRRNSS